MPFVPPRRCAIDGEGMQNFAVFVAADFRNAKWSTMFGRLARMRPVTVGVGGISSTPWNLSVVEALSPMPSKPERKSRCHQSRRNSPSVTASRPIASCFATASRMRAIFDLCERDGGELAALRFRPRFSQLGRAEQTADVVGAERAGRWDIMTSPREAARRDCNGR